MPVANRLVLEGEVGTDGDKKNKSRCGRGRLVFECDRFHNWTCRVEYFHMCNPTVFTLNDKDVQSLSTEFVDTASRGFLSFFHQSGGAYVTYRCLQPKKPAVLEDVVVLLLSVKNNRSFEVEKADSGFKVRQAFTKNQTFESSRRGNCGPYPRCSWGGGQQFGYRGPPPRSRMERRHTYGGSFRNHNNKDQGHYGNFQPNRSPCSYDDVNWRQGYYGHSVDRFKMRNQSYPYDRNHAHTDRWNGYRGKHEHNMSSADFRYKEHVSRRQQPLKDRGSAENSLDRAEDNRESRTAAFMGLSTDFETSDSSSSEGNYASSRNAFYGTRNENDDPKLRSMTRVSVCNDSSPVDRRFYGRAPHLSQRTSWPPYSSVNKRNNHALVIGPAKKQRFDSPRISPNQENKENVDDASHVLKQTGYVSGEQGFKNFGFTCYLNTAMRAMFNMESFASDLLAVHDSLKDVLMDNSILRYVCELLIATKSDDKSQYGEHYEHPLKAFLEVVLGRWKGFRGYSMQDAHEFLLQILDFMKDEIDERLPAFKKKMAVPAGNPIKTNFEYEMEEIYTCLKCAHVARRKQVHYDMGVSVPKQKHSAPCKSLQVAMKSIFKVEEREVKCASCKHNKCSVNVRLSKLPRVLIVHLKRYMVKSTKAVKRNVPVTVPKYLTLQGYCSPDACLNSAGSSMDPASWENEDCSITSSQLSLGSSTETVAYPVNSSSQKETDGGLKNVMSESTPPLFSVELAGGVDTGNILNNGLKVPCVDDEHGAKLSSQDEVKRSSDAVAGSKAGQEPANDGNTRNAEMDWPAESTEEEQISEAITNSLQQEEDDIQKATRLSLQDLESPNGSASDDENCNDEDDEDDEEEDEEGEEPEIYRKNYETGELPNSYVLVSVMRHTGSISHGHYTCICCDSEGKWKIYNDSNIENITEEEALEIAKKDGYVSLYRHK